MKNRVTVDVAGQEYTLISEEDPVYVRKVAAAVNEEIKAITSGARLSLTTAAVLACVKMADRAGKAEEAAAHLRGQVKNCLDEQSKIRHDLAEARREISKLKDGKR